MSLTGPPYPKLPSPGSNAVGVGAVGISQVGTIPNFQFFDTIISQYANSPRIVALIQAFANAADQTQNFDAFYDYIWNLDTAIGYGLDVWGRIVGVNRVLQVPIQQFFGFAEAGDGLPFGDANFQGWTAHFGFAEAGDASPFGQAPFGAQKVWGGVDPNAGGGVFYGGGALTSNYAMSDQTYRQVIYAKAAANICDGSIPSINKLLLKLFPGRGNCYVSERALPNFFGFAEAGDALPFGDASFQGWTSHFGFAEAEDSLGFGQSVFGAQKIWAGVDPQKGSGPFYSGQQIVKMTIMYVFRFALSPVEQAIVAQSGVLPKPPGVAAFVSILP